MSLQDALGAARALEGRGTSKPPAGGRGGGKLSQSGLGSRALGRALVWAVLFLSFFFPSA